MERPVARNRRRRPHAIRNARWDRSSSTRIPAAMPGRVAAVTGPAVHAISASLHGRQAMRLGVEATEERTATTRARQGGGPSWPRVQHRSCPGNSAPRLDRMRRGCAGPAGACSHCAPPPSGGARSLTGDDETREPCSNVRRLAHDPRRQRSSEDARSKLWALPRTAHARRWCARPYVPVHHCELPQHTAAGSRHMPHSAAFHSAILPLLKRQDAGQAARRGCSRAENLRRECSADGSARQWLDQVRSVAIQASISTRCRSILP
jgi:hypothetical protein